MSFPQRRVLYVTHLQSGGHYSHQSLKRHHSAIRLTQTWTETHDTHAPPCLSLALSQREWREKGGVAALCTQRTFLPQGHICSCHKLICCSTLKLLRLKNQLVMCPPVLTVCRHQTSHLSSSAAFNKSWRWRWRWKGFFLQKYTLPSNCTSRKKYI